MSGFDLETVKDAINVTYPGLMLLGRDVNLPQELASKYTSGLIVRERAFTDATPRLGGMVTTHRFVIMSNHMVDFDALVGGDDDGTVPEWRLHVANRDSRFKVLGKADIDGRTLIFLLHLPDDARWRIFAQSDFDIDEHLLEDALARMIRRLEQEPIPDVTSERWLERCQFPLGMSDNGDFFPLE